MPRPVPVPNADTAPYWDAAAREELCLQQCESCGAMQSVPRIACAACHGTRLAWRRASGRGQVASFSVVHRAPTKAFEDDLPYVLALVDLVEGVRLMLNIRGEDREHVAIGDLVEIFFEERGTEGFKLPQARRVGSSS